LAVVDSLLGADVDRGLRTISSAANAAAATMATAKLSCDALTLCPLITAMTAC
jgi:hypothetical protein